MAQASFHVCYHCKDRTVGCHSKCKAYLAEKEANEKERAERNAQRGIDNTLYRNAGYRMGHPNRKK